MRTCVGCQAEGEAKGMIRLILGPDGQVVPDLRRSAFGRGAWVHPQTDCIRKAAPRGLSRSFKTKVATSAETLWRELCAQADRRVDGLVSSARAAGKVEAGSDAVRKVVESGVPGLVIVARDARASADTTWVRAAVASGRAVGWGSKERLGAAIGRTATGVAAIVDRRIAEEVAATVAVANIPAPSGSNLEGRMYASAEVR